MKNVPKAIWNREADRWETLEPWGVFSETLPKSGMTRNGRLYEREILVPHIGESASLSLGKGQNLPTPSANDSQRGGSNPDVRKAKKQQITLNDAAYAMGSKADPVSPYGRYDGAVRRWESVFRPAPYPVDVNSRGNEHLSPRFSEWMMGLPEGWVTSPEIGLSRAQQLKALGNGVVPQQASAALGLLLDRDNNFSFVD